MLISLLKNYWCFNGTLGSFNFFACCKICVRMYQCIWFLVSISVSHLNNTNGFGVMSHRIFS